MAAIGALGGLGALSSGYELGQQDVAKRAYERAVMDQMLRKRVEDMRQRQVDAGVFGALQQMPGDLSGMGQSPEQQPQQQPIQPQQLAPQPQQRQTGPLLDPGRQLQPRPGGGYTAKGSWFGSTPGWRDPMSGSQTASGVPLSVPGIALPSRAGLGKQFDVTAPSGQTMRLPQTDVGPAAWTGRGVDINSAAAQQMGYTPATFPTDQQFTVHPVDREFKLPPAAAAASTQAAQQIAQMAPPQMRGQIGLQQLVPMIERSMPNAPPDVKAGVLYKLAPLLNEEAKIQMDQAWKRYTFETTRAETQAHHVATEKSSQELRGIERERLDLERQRVGQAEQRLGQERRAVGGLEGDILRQMDEERKAKGLPPMGAVERAKALADLKGQARPPGRQAQTQMTALELSANEVSRSLSNLVDMNIGQTSGLFMGTQMIPGEKLRDSLSRSVGAQLTTTQQGMVDLAFQGVGRALAAMENAGRATGMVAMTRASQALKPQLGDSNYLVLGKLAEIRQITEQAVEVMSKSREIGDPERELLKSIAEKMKKEVPYTIQDINSLLRTKGDVTVKDWAKTVGAEGASAREKGQKGGGAGGEYATYQDVLNAVDAGKLKPEEAKRIIVERFGAPELTPQK